MASEREVLFSLRVGTYTGNEQELRAFGDRVLAEERRITKGIADEVSKRKRAIDLASRKSLEALTKRSATDMLPKATSIPRAPRITPQGQADESSSVSGFVAPQARPDELKHVQETEQAKRRIRGESEDAYRQQLNGRVKHEETAAANGVKATVNGEQAKRKAVNGTAREHKSVLDRQAKWEEEWHRRKANAAAAGLENDKEFMALSSKEQEKVLKNRLKLTSQFHKQKAREETSAAKEAERIARAEEKDADRIHHRHRQRQRSTALENRRQREQEARATELHTARMQSQLASSQQAIKTANFEAAESFSAVAGSMTQMGRGLVFLAASSEEEAAEMLKLVATAQGYFDLVVGGTQTVKNLAKGFDALGKSRKAQMAADEASAALASRSATTSATALASETAAANAATAAHTRLHAARGGGGGVNVGGAARTGARGMLGRAAGVGAGLLGMGGIGIGGGAAGAGAAGGGAAVAGGGGMAAIAAPIAAAAGVLAAAGSTLLTAGQAMKHGVGGGADHGSAVDRIATFEVNTVAKLDRMVSDSVGLYEKSAGEAATWGDVLKLGVTQAINPFHNGVKGITKSAVRLEKQQEAHAKKLEMLTREDAFRAQQVTKETSEIMEALGRTREEQGKAAAKREIAGANNIDAEGDRRQSGIRNEQADIQQQMRQSSAPDDLMKLQNRLDELSKAQLAVDLKRASRPFDQRRDERITQRSGIDTDLAGIREAMEKASEQLSAADRKGAQTQTLDALKQRIDGLKQQEKSLNDSRESLNNEAHAKAKEQAKAIYDLRLRHHENEIAKTRELMTVAREKFREEEARLKGSKQQFGALDPMEQKRMIDLAQRAKADGVQGMSVEQMNAIGGIDKMHAQMRDAELMRRADTAGFDQHFGRQERDAMGQAKRDELNLNLKMEDLRKFEITVGTESGNQELLRKLEHVLRTAQDRRDKEVVDWVNTQLADVQQQIRRNAQAKFKQNQ